MTTQPPINPDPFFENSSDKNAIAQPSTNEMSDVIKRINELGTASESLFSRLYKNIGRRQPNGTTQVLIDLNRELQRQAEHAVQDIERLNAILATIDEGIIMQDNEGKLQLVNAAARELLGTIKAFWESELGTMFREFHETNVNSAEILPLSAPKRIQVNNRILGAQLAGLTDEQGERIGTIIVLRDVTGDSLSERLKEQFVTAISHELRTPMTAIKGMSEVIQGQIQAGNPPTYKMLETLTRNVDILDRMIVELLDISEITSDDMMLQLEPIDIQDLLWSVHRGMRPEITKLDHDVRVMVRDTNALMIQGDQQKLRWALGHLLQNSIRYTEKKGVILLTARNDESTISIQVMDTGVGISERDMPHIFDKFYRGQPRTGDGTLIDPRGLGQGLFIARKVIEAHGGYLRVRSELGKGSLFTLVLPHQKSA